MLSIYKTIDDIYENLEDYDPTEEKRVLIVFDDMISDMESNKKLLNFKKKKLSISLVFISQSYLKVPKTIRLNATL